MSSGWKAYRGAPEEGTLVCAEETVPERGTLCLDLDGFPLLLVRVDGRITAYVNACPHQYLPLNHKGDKVISADQTVLRCTNHAAGFSVATGEGVEGLGIGACLDAVPVHSAAEQVIIGPAPD